jgi:hypothetical protein
MDDPRPSLPELATISACDYFTAATKSTVLLHFIIDQAVYGDFVQHTARVALDESLELSKITPEELLNTNPGPRIKALRKMRQELLERFLASAVDNFETYVVSILREILQKEPRPLANREQNVAVEYVLKFKSIQELTNELSKAK